MKSARNWAKSSNNATYAAYLEYNARNQITLWGPTGQINDYASKQWAGLIGTYYLPRWQMFTQYLVDVKNNGTTFNATTINEQLLNFGVDWDLMTWGEGKGETWGTKGDTWTVIKSIMSRYT
jgi:alpha-N-acetylglucosaminidase